MSFRELVETHLAEVSRTKLSNYISGAKADETKDRSTGIKLAQKKKWGDAKYGFEEPKVKATNEGSSINDLLTAHAKSIGKKITTQAGKEIKPEHRLGDKPTLPAQSGSDDKGYGKGRYMGDDINASSIAVNESENHAIHFLKAAHHALGKAASLNPDTEEHHKWMIVHHSAMSNHHDALGNSHESNKHYESMEHHKEHVPEDDYNHDFNWGESHHWSKLKLPKKSK